MQLKYFNPLAKKDVERGGPANPILTYYINNVSLKKAIIVNGPL